MSNNRYTKEMLEDAVKKSIGWADVCRKINVKPYNGAQAHVKKRAIDFGIDYSHFTGKAHARGKEGKRKDIKTYLNNLATIKSHDLKNRLIREGLKKHECEKCHSTTWNGEPIPLELDHKNSNHWDNSWDNIWIICPNCHAQETLLRRKNIAQVM